VKSEEAATARRKWIVQASGACGVSALSAAAPAGATGTRGTRWQSQGGADRRAGAVALQPPVHPFGRSNNRRAAGAREIGRGGARGAGPPIGPLA
jgi:hypothetical protein